MAILTTLRKSDQTTCFVSPKLLLSLVLLLFFTTVKASNFYSRANTAWNVASTWSNSGYGGTSAPTTPGAGDIVYIGNGYSVTVGSNASCASLTIDTGGTMTVSGTASFSATSGIIINGTYTNQSTGAITTPSWTCNGTYNHATSSPTLPLGTTTSTWAANSNLNITGSYTTATVLNNFVGQTFGNFTFNPSAMTNSVALIGAAGTTTIQGNFTITQTGSNTLYMRISGTIFAGVITINGNFTLTAGTFDLHNGGPSPTDEAINLKGNFTMSGTSTLTESTTTTGSNVGFNFTGTGVQAVSIAPTTSITSQGTTATCAIQFTVASGATIDMGTSVLTGTNNTSFTLSPGASIITANTSGLSATGASGSIQVGGTINYSTTANYTYNGNAAQVTGTGLPTTVNNLTLNNSSGVTVSSAETINGTLALSPSALVNLNTFNLYASTLTIGGVVESTGSYGGVGSGATNTTSNFTAGAGKILAGVIPPMNLSYNTPNTFPPGTVITALNPTVTGTVVSYSVSPALPTGLSLNTTTGIISGTPSINTPPATYTVTATNTGGSTTFDIVISIANKRYAVNSTTAVWNLTSTWSATSGGSPGASVPVAGDIVFIGDAAVARAVTIPAGYSASCDSLTIGNSTNNTANSLTLSASNASLTVYGDININRPSGGNTNALNVNTGTVTVGGSVTLAGTATQTNRISTIIITTGTLNIAGDLTFISGSNISNVITMSGGAGTLNLAGAFNATLGTLTPGTTSTFNYNGASQTVTDISSIAYNHLTLSGSGTKTLVAGTTSITGNLTLSGTASATTVANLAVGGNLTIGAGTTLTTGSNFTLGVTGTSSITGTLTLAGTGAKTFTGDVTVNSGGIWNETGIASLNLAGSLTNNGTFTANTGTHTFSGATKNLSGTSAIVIPTASITGSYTNSGTLTCSTALSGATLTQATTGILNIGGTSAITTLAATATGNTVTYYGGIQTVKNAGYYNLTLSGTGAKTTTASVAVSNVLSMEGTGAATATVAPTYGATATLQYNTTSAMITGAEWITPFPATGGVIIKNTGVITQNAAKVFNVSVPLTINANASLVTNNFQLTFGGNFTNNGTFTAGSSPIIITNSMSSQNISGFTTTGNVTMTKTGGTATLQGNVSATSLIVNGTGGGTLHLGTGLTHVFSGTVTLTAGSLNGGSSILNENATSATAWNGTGNLFTAGTGTVIFGGVAQTISATGTTTFNNLTFTNSGAKTFSNTVAVNGLLSMEGQATATITGTLTYGSSATLQYKGSSTQTTGSEFVSPFPGSGGVKINNSNGVTLGSARSLGTNPFTIGDVTASSVFNDGGFQLTATGTLNLTSGSYNVNYSSFPAFTTTNISTGTTVNYSSATPQTVKGIAYSNLTISGTGTNSKIADGNITVNGILNLVSVNASATQGCLDMNTTPFTLTMGATATTTGTGDVTGIVTRTSFAVNTPYSFGNQFTTINMQAGWTLPTSVSVKIYLTSTHTWKSNAINRYYDIAQSGGNSGTLVTLSLHYLTGELNGNTEGNLDLFDYHVSGNLSLDDHGRSNFNTTDKWVGVTNRAITYIAPNTVFPSKYWTLGNSTAPSFTWLGATDSDWTKADNWTGTGTTAPGPTDAVVIPDAATTNNDPTLPTNTTIGSLNIKSGGILNGGSGTTLTISGGTGAWNNLGTFNAGTSTVSFTSPTATMADPTSFYNVTVADGANLTLGLNNIMRIGGTLSLIGSGVLNAAGNNNTVEYNGTNQTVILPNGSTAGYSNLILSGSGIKTMPSSAMTVYGDFTTTGTTTATAGNNLNIVGNVTLGSGTTFAASTYNHTVSGNWTNNGATFTPGSSTITFNNTAAAQAINGTAASQTFYNMIIAKTAQTLSVGGSTTSLTANNLTETSGNFTAPATTTITGTTTLAAGTFTAGATTSMTGNVTLTAGTYVAGATTNLSGNWTNNGATFTAGSGTVNMTGSSPQTITGASTFNNLTVNNTSGVTGSTDLTVNGILNLQSANASATTGALDMGTHTLNLGINGAITGSGDLTGTTTRTHNFTTNTNYTFGNSISTIKFNAVNGTQTFPTSISVKLTIGSALSWGSTTPANATKRQYELSYTGSASGNHTVFQMYYLDSEFASGINESTLSIWSHVPGTDYTTDEGWSTYDVTQNYIDISDIDFANLPSTLQVGIAPTSATLYTWNGSQGTDWNTPANWTPNGIPAANYGTLIPDGATTPNDPNLPVGATSEYLIIESGGILNSITNASLLLTGHGDVWSVEPAAGSLAAGVFHAGSSTVTISNTSAFSTLVGSTDFYNLTILDNAQLRMTSGSYTGIAGTLSLSSNGVLDARTNPNTIEFKGTNQTITNTNFATPGYTNLIINSGTSGTITWPATLNIGGDFTNNKTGLSIPGTVIFDGTSAQTIGGSASSTFTNLTINNPAGVIGASNLSVNGALTFNNDNPATNDKGALALATDIILDMGANSSTTGPGEVSGIVRRAHTFSTETAYSFGSQINTLTFAAVSGQTLPSSISLKIAIGTAPDWSGHSGAVISNPIKRLYGIIQTGASGTRALLQVHYKDNEIPAGISESNLTIWSCFFNGTTYTNVESGRSGFNTDLNYVTIQDVNFAVISGTWGYFQSTLAPSSALNHTWTGAISTDWTSDSNWAPNGAPNSTIGAIIPSTYTTTYAPTLPAAATCKSLQINAGGVLNAPAGGVFTITGANAPWSVETGGVFNANTSNVLFNAAEASVGAIAIIGTTNFYDLTIASGTSLRPALDSYMGIAGTLTNNGTLAAATNESTIEFNGSSTQNILNPNGSTPGYHNLILSGSGTKYLPSTLNIVDEFTNNTSGTVVTGTGTVILNGNSIYGQAIGGTTLTTFNNLTIDNPANTVTAETDFAVDGTLNIVTGSIMDMGVYALGGAISSISGTGTLYTQNPSSTPVPTGKTWTETVTYNGTGAQTLVTGTYTNLSVNNNAGVTAGGDVTVNGTLTTVTGSNVDLGTNQLLGSPSGITNDGTIITQNTSTLPIPAGKTWGGNGTVLYNGNSTQTAVAGIFNNMTIDNSAGIVLTDSATVNGTLLINSDRNMVIAPGAKMTAQQITNNAGVSGLTIKSSPTAPNGTLIFNNTSMNPVSATVEMYSKASWDKSNQTPGGKYKWQFFGIPVSTAVASPLFDGDYVRQYNEAGIGSGFTSDKRWIQQVNSSVLSPFTGYEITQPAAGTYTFQGQLVNSNFSQPLSYTQGADSPGQHILSNPYTAAIDIANLSFGADLDQTVYLYNTGSLADWNGQSGSGESPGQYLSIPIHTVGTGGIPSQIPSMQGFLIRTDTTTYVLTTFGIPYSAVATRNKDIQRARRAAIADMVYTRIDIRGNHFSDKMWIFTNASCTHGYDNGWDGSKFLGSSLAPQLWAMEANGDYQVDAVDNINNTELGFIRGQDSTYTMTFTHENPTSYYHNLYLIDLFENTTTDISVSGTNYSFTAPIQTQSNKRFKIVTTPNLPENNTTIVNAGLKIYSSEKTIYVQNPGNATGRLKLYSVSGLLIRDALINAGTITTIPTDLPAGVYLAKGNIKDEELTESIILR